MRVAFIGAGTMAEAIIRSVLKKKILNKEDIFVSDILPHRLDTLHQEYGITGAVDNEQAVAKADIVVLSVKPQNLHDISADLSRALNSRQTVASIMAGVSISTLERSLKHQSIVRIMPNTPAQIGAGMSVWTATKSVPRQAVEQIKVILKALGEEIYVKEEKYVDMATAVSGSGPAFMFLIIESLVDAGVHIGLPHDTAKMLAVQTALGSALLVKESGKHTAELRDMVSSPGGTTVEGLLELEKGQVKADLIKAVTAAYNKSLKLAEAASHQSEGKARE